VLLTTAETAVERANAAAERVEAADDTLERAGMLSQVAKEVADEALHTADQAVARAESVKGVFVGSGEMPDGYAVQIDPNGAAVDLEQIVRPPVAVLYDGDAEAADGMTSSEPVTTVLYDPTRPSALPYRVFRLWVGDTGVAIQTATPLTLVVDGPFTEGYGTVGQTTEHDRYGNRFYLRLYRTADGTMTCHGTRTDAQGNTYSLGIYRIVGIV
jgi:hypothetical protein